MKVSIITCTLNSEEYLEETIKSVLGQGYPDIEFIVVDGNSSDDTLNIVKKYEDKIRWISERDSGISEAMNKGILLASGDIIYHLHSDDYLLHGSAISTVVNIFKDRGCSWLFGNVKNLINGRLYDLNYRIPPYSYKRLLRRNFIAHPSTFIKREVFEKAGVFDTSLKYAMDYDMWLRIGRLYEPFQTNECFAVFRRHAKRVTVQGGLKALREDYLVRRRYVKRKSEEAEHFLRFAVRLVRYLLRSQ